VLSSRRSQFAGTLIFVIATQVFVASLIGTLNLEDSLIAALLFIVSGAVLIAAGVSRIGFALSARVAGTVSYVLGTFTFGAMQDNVSTSIGALIIAVVLFAMSTRLLQLEVIAGGAIAVTLTTSILVSRVIDDQVVQGLAIVIIGIAMVVAAGAVNKKRRSS
jgi:hypothetical protein